MRLINGISKNIGNHEFKSKSVYDFREKNGLFICNMVTYQIRKIRYEKSTSRYNSNSLQAVNLAKKNGLNGIL